MSDMHETARETLKLADLKSGEALSEDFAATTALVGIGYALLALDDTLTGFMGGQPAAPERRG
jgi:hypothetical protein